MIFEELRRYKAPIREMRERMDRASAMVRDGINALEEVLGSLGSPFDPTDRNQIARELLKQDYAQTVYSSILSKIDPEEGPSQQNEVTSPSVHKDHDVLPPAFNDHVASHPAFNDHVSPPPSVDQVILPVARDHVFQVHMQEFAQVMANNMLRNRLPVPVPCTFSGNPLEFVEFERSFRTLIGERIPPAEKLYHLKQYVTGPAKDAIAEFFYGETEAAYEGAWKTLKERYGHPFRVQQAFRDKLSNWPKVSPKDAPALQKFTDYLGSCRDAKPYVEGLQVLDDCPENQKLLNKLPEWLVLRWNRVVTDSLEKCKRYPSFTEFVTFVSKEARIANNPVSSLIALRGQEVSSKGESRINERREVASTKVSAFRTEGYERDDRRASAGMKDAKLGDEASASNQSREKEQNNKWTPKPCSLCADMSHRLEKCPQFRAKTLEERKEFIQESRLCFGCLRKGHFSKDCTRRHKCDTCSKRHPTLLHEYRSDKVDEGTHTEGSSQDMVTSNKVHTGNQASTSMIVPVWVFSAQAPSTEILTYALLDTHSDTSFILEDVARALSVSSQPVCLKLSTMTSSSTIDSDAISGLSVRGMTLPTKLKIEKCYTRDFIPADRTHIPTRKTAEGWTHLQYVAPEIPALQGCEVGMLIGYNCSRALVPRQVLTGTDTEPYAVRTDLGWSIVGSSASKTVGDWTSQCHRVTTREMQMPLPFKNQHELPNNRRLASIRFQHLKGKMETDDQYKDHYLAFMTDIVNGGYAERAENKAPLGPTNYIPHHGIYHSKKNELRIVFDCSAKFAERASSDQQLDWGPVQIQEAQSSCAL
ncbi:uncharacterized protein LOC100889672 [Strongylocentrotus purpuratus]|uniref:CCHC-type domain-containing protein n=1 Tax=Strongylocentrotus purpuratus TaxID=7668 RepID=A0A7M7GGS2_STRPU|nr:uncharacterized protein LOC100889672 [Strongylocentrotus purpuratus]|eukprot:XP_003725647.1 PREDICTED: uncharacterized protein LOC100889672 [Strongylocentrotus purpuratus]